ncbi:hypothetical protein OE88DRAFT_1334909 [Heliocybe sulcata]|uniref:Uncharacterized protein n=1 Tax=Heliocybe sulcata TaxID=5364 RepID=A0A5C3N739_9AGAM|nr:hypothetical protein OE88DRAFT_1334909 [Heliocybe sulcata]
MTSVTSADSSPIEYSVPSLAGSALSSAAPYLQSDHVNAEETEGTAERVPHALGDSALDYMNSDSLRTTSLAETTPAEQDGADSKGAATLDIVAPELEDPVVVPREDAMFVGLSSPTGGASTMPIPEVLAGTASGVPNVAHTASPATALNMLPDARITTPSTNLMASPAMTNPLLATSLAAPVVGPSVPQEVGGSVASSSQSSTLPIAVIASLPDAPAVRPAAVAPSMVPPAPSSSVALTPATSTTVASMTASVLPQEVQLASNSQAKIAMPNLPKTSKFTFECFPGTGTKESASSAITPVPVPVSKPVASASARYNPGKAVPDKFKLLVQYLERERVSGRQSKTWSQLTLDFWPNEEVYRRAGTRKFRTHMREAVDAGIIDIAGAFGSTTGRVHLKDRWHGSTF